MVTVPDYTGSPKELGAEPSRLFPAAERMRRQALANALLICDWDVAANDILYRDGIATRDEFDILRNSLVVARDRPEKTSPQRSRIDAAIRQLDALLDAQT